MVKIFLFLIFVLRIQTNNCDGKFIVTESKTVTIGDKNYIGLDDCDNPIAEEFGIPCDEIFVYEDALFTLIPVNPRTLDYLN